MRRLILTSLVAAALGLYGLGCGFHDIDDTPGDDPVVYVGDNVGVYDNDDPGYDDPGNSGDGYEWDSAGDSPTWEDFGDPGDWGSDDSD